MSENKKQIAVIMDRKKIHDCFMIKSPPEPGSKRTKLTYKKMSFYIYPLPLRGSKYEYLVEAEQAIDWGDMQKYINRPKLQNLSFEERDKRDTKRWLKIRRRRQ